MKKLLIVLASLSIMGCGPYLKMSPGLDVSKPHDALLTSAIIDGNPVDDTSAGSTSIVGAAVSLANNIDLAPFGDKMITQVSKYLAQHSFNVRLDPARAKKLDPIKVSDDSVVKGVAQVLGGVWTSTNTSYYAMRSSLYLTDSNREDIAKKLDTESPNEAFVFIYAEIRDESSWFFMSKPQVSIYIRILNEQGQDIFESKSFGSGGTSFWWADRSPENLSKAVDAALAQLNTLEKGTL